MTGRFALWLALWLASPFVHADEFLVQFKTDAAFDEALAAITVTAPSGFKPGRVHVLDTSLVLARALTHVRLLVVSGDEEGAARLKRHPAVAAVEAAVHHAAPRAYAATPAREDVSRAITPDLVARPWGIDAIKAPAAWSVTRGEGARVMVLDSGVDRFHPSLRSRFEKGLNFTSADPAAFEDRDGHGTHVAGTILGDGHRGGVVGVAPGARLLAAKICDEDKCNSTAIAAGLDWAVEEDVDVVNLSLAGESLTGMEEAALRRAEEAGVVVVAAAGNEGKGFVSYPAAAPSVLAVGAVGPDLKRADFSQWGRELAVVAPGVDVLSSLPRGAGRVATLAIGGRACNVRPALGIPTGDVEAELVAAGFGLRDDYRGIDVRGRVAVIKRGQTRFIDKMRLAIERGARGVIFVNLEDKMMTPALGLNGHDAPIPAVLIEQAAGEAVLQRLAARERVTATLKVGAADYAELQGTSMAAPHVSGVALLVRAANRALTPADVRAVIRDSASTLGSSDQNEYGRGLVDAAAAVQRAAPPLISQR